MVARSRRKTHKEAGFQGVISICHLDQDGSIILQNPY